MIPTHFGNTAFAIEGFAGIQLGGFCEKPVTDHIWAITGKINIGKEMCFS